MKVYRIFIGRYPGNDISTDLPRLRLQFNKATAVLDSVILPCSTVFYHCLHLSSKLSHLRNIFMGTLSRDDDSKFQKFQKKSNFYLLKCNKIKNRIEDLKFSRGLEEISEENFKLNVNRGKLVSLRHLVPFIYDNIIIQYS